MPSAKHKTEVPAGARLVPTRTTAPKPRPFGFFQPINRKHNWEAPNTLLPRATEDEKITELLT